MTPWRRPSSLASLVAALLVTACSSGSGGTDGNDPPPPPPPPPPPASGIPFPAGEGIKQGVSLSSLKTAGWSVCFDETYATDALTLSTVLDRCAGRYMALACSNGPSDSLALAAGDLRKVVTQPDPASSLDLTTEHHVAGTVGWYFNTDYSWGFFPAGAGVNRNTCDWDADGTQTDKALRLCWPTSQGEIGAGYRCGANDLHANTYWRRLILSYPAVEEEPNETIGQATAIDVGDRVMATISSTADADVYAFTVPAGGADVLFQTFDAWGVACDPTNLTVDPALDVYDGTGTLVAHVVDGSTGGRCPDASVRLLEGPNYVTVTGAAPVPFTYTLKVTIP